MNRWIALGLVLVTMLFSQRLAPVVAQQAVLPVVPPYFRTGACLWIDDASTAVRVRESLGTWIRTEPGRRPLNDPPVASPFSALKMGGLWQNTATMKTIVQTPDECDPL